jgi:hypothetical protein
MTEPMRVGKYPVSLLLDILIDGIEWSARGFWAQIESYKWTEWYENGEEFGEPKSTLTPDTVLLRVRDIEDDEEPNFVGITLADLAGATDWALEEYAHLFGYTVSQGKITDIDYDAIGADVIIQRIVLGEVVYG